MNQLFQLNPALCPLAIAEIKRRCADAQRDYTAFRGLCYQVTVGGQVWHVGNRDSDPSEVCNWTDADFGLSPLVEDCLAETLPQSDSVKAHYAQQRLEQAAPELLEALKALHGVLDLRLSSGLAVNQVLPEEVFALFYGPAIAARAAIAKATNA